MRHSPKTPLWVLQAEYYEQVAKDAELLGKRLKAAWFRRKADKAVSRAGGSVIHL